MEESRSRKASGKTDLHHAKLRKAELGEHDLRDVTTAEIERWRRRRAGEPTRQGDAPSAATIRHAIVFLSSVFTLAIRDGKAATNPCKSIKLPKLNNARVRFLRDEERELERLQEAF